jgi:hypothetical protein
MCASCVWGVAFTPAAGTADNVMLMPQTHKLPRRLSVALLGCENGTHKLSTVANGGEGLADVCHSQIVKNDVLSCQVFPCVLWM